MAESSDELRKLRRKVAALEQRRPTSTLRIVVTVLVVLMLLPLARAFLLALYGNSSAGQEAERQKRVIQAQIEEDERRSQKLQRDTDEAIERFERSKKAAEDARRPR